MISPISRVAQSIEERSCRSPEVCLMNKRERRLPLPPTDIVTVLACSAAVFFILAFSRKALEGYRLQRHNAILSAQIAELSGEQARLEERLAYVQSEAYVEQVAREQYKWAKPGEKVVFPIFRRHRVAVAPPTPSGPAVETADSESMSYWPAWWRLLSGAFD
jgi:hypothetical protein